MPPLTPDRINCFLLLLECFVHSVSLGLAEILGITNGVHVLGSPMNCVLGTAVQTMSHYLRVTRGLHRA